MIRRRAFLGLLVAVPVTGTLVRPALSATPEIFVNGGAAINGYDPVAYFTDGRPVRGSDAITSEWNGATWWFATAENKASFDADPEAYAPQYGGYCAWAVAEGYTASTDPDAWKIEDGKLYLNFSRRIQRRWERDIPGNIARADANWPRVLGN